MMPSKAFATRNSSIGQLYLVVFALPLVLQSPKRVSAQPVFVPAQPSYGGQLVQELVPYQPTVVLSEPTQSPIYLEQHPELSLTQGINSGESIVSFQPITQQSPPPQTSQLPPGVRKGLFQRLFFNGTYLPRLEGDSLGISNLEAGIVFGVPFFRVTAPLLITPRFAVNYLDGPNAPDLPARLHDAEVSFRHLRKFGDGPWAMNAAVTLGYYSDFESSDADAFRVTGQAFAIYESSPTTKWIGGIVYLNREDLSVVPALGVIYEPTPYAKYEAILPRPRVSWRLPDGTLNSQGERWAYIGAEFGGGIWAIQTPGTTDQDLLTYNDYRITAGFERRIVGGLTRRIEVGYVFGRELEFRSTTTDVDLDDSLFIRAGVTY